MNYMWVTCQYYPTTLLTTYFYSLSSGTFYIQVISKNTVAAFREKPVFVLKFRSLQKLFDTFFSDLTDNSATARESKHAQLFVFVEEDDATLHHKVFVQQ